MKSDGVQDIFTWLKEKCKEEKTKVQIAEKEYEKTKKTCHFEDEQCLIDSAERNVEIAKARLNAFVGNAVHAIRISGSGRICEIFTNL